MYLHKSQATLAISGILAATQFIVFSSHASEEVETITITGSRIPVQMQDFTASLSVINEQELKQSGAIQISDVLSGLAGVAISSSGNMGALTEIRLRGSESNHLLVVLDGVIINDDSQGGLVDLAHISVTDVKKIALLRGPQAAAWGSGAIGGVLYITTHEGTNEDKKLASSITAGNKNTRQAVMQYSGHTNAHQYAISLQHVKTDGDNISRYGTEKDGYKRSIVNTHYRYRNNQIEANATIRLTDLKNEYDSVDYAVTGLPVDANNFTEGQKLSAKMSMKYSPHRSDYATSLIGTFSKHENENYEFGEFSSSAVSERFQLSNLHSINWGNNRTILGAEYLQRLYTQRGIVGFADPNQRQDSQTLSAFLETHTELSEQIDFMLGARFDHNSEYDNAVSYRSGVSWHINANYTTFVSLGKAIKNPTFTERFGYFPTTFLGNPDLQPEFSQEWELGIRARFTNSFQGQASVYNAQLKDEILGFVFDPVSGLMTAMNADSESTRNGFDTELSWRWATMNWRASYSYLDATQDSSTLNQTEFRRPRHSGGLSVSGSINEKISAYFKWTYSGSKTDAFFPPPEFTSQTVLLRPYSLFSVNIGYELAPSWQVSLRMQNALNQEYEDIMGFSGETKSVLLSLTYSVAQ